MSKLYRELPSGTSRLRLSTRRFEKLHVWKILPCKRDLEGGKIHDRYAVTIVESNNMPFDNDATILTENFRG